MKHVNHGGKAVQVTDEYSHLDCDVRTEHLQRNLTRWVDKFLAEEGIANKGPGSRIVVRRAFESAAFLVSVQIIAGSEYPIDSAPSMHQAYFLPPWDDIARAPLNERLLLGAFDYYGSGKHAVVIGEGVHSDDRSAGPCWRVDLGNGEQTFTPTHWQPVPRLVRK